MSRFQLPQCLWGLTVTQALNRAPVLLTPPPAPPPLPELTAAGVRLRVIKSHSRPRRHLAGSPRWPCSCGAVRSGPEPGARPGPTAPVCGRCWTACGRPHWPPGHWARVAPESHSHSRLTAGSHLAQRAWCLRDPTPSGAGGRAFLWPRGEPRAFSDRTPGWAASQGGGGCVQLFLYKK